MRSLNEAQPVSDNSEGIQERSAFLDDASALVTPGREFSSNPTAAVSLRMCYFGNNR